MRLIIFTMKYLNLHVLCILLCLTLINNNVVVNSEVRNSVVNVSQSYVSNANSTKRSIRSSQIKSDSNKRQLLSETTNNLQSINSLSSPKDVTRSFSMPFLINKYLDFQKQCKHYSVTAFFKRDLPAGILPMDVSTSKHKMYQNMILNHATQLAHRHEFWPYIGFYFFSQKTLEIYRYLESSASKHWYLKSLMSDSNINKDPLLSLSLSTAVFMLSNNLTMIEAISTSLNSKASDNFCAKKDEYFCMLHSMDKNADFVNATEYCSKIEKEGITVPFLQRCEKHLMTEKKINFDIEANFSVNPTYYNIYSPSNKEAEGNYYLLALTAIENLNRWFDYHRFCFNSLLSGLKNNFLDIEILPSWKSVHYFYVHYNKTVKTPAAILAKKVQKIKKRPETIVRYLLVVRDARTTMESFSQIDTDTLGETDTKKRGIFSQGYTKIFAFSAASILENIIRSEAKTLTKNHTIKVIVVAKGSYGVGTAMVILRELIDSLTPDTLIDSHFLANSKINYTMIAFSSNSVGDIDFINYLKRRATFRHIVEKNWFMHTHQNLQYPCEKEMEPISSVSKIIETVPGMVQFNSDILYDPQNILLTKFEVLQKVACPVQSSIEALVCGKPEFLNDTIGCHSGQKFFTFISPKF